MVKKILIEISSHHIGSPSVIQLYDSETKDGVKIVDNYAPTAPKQGWAMRMISFQQPKDVGINNKYTKTHISPKNEADISRDLETDEFEIMIDPDDIVNESDIPVSPKMAHKSTYKINLPEGALESLLAKADEFENHSQIIQEFSYVTNALSGAEVSLRQYFKIEEERINSGMSTLNTVLRNIKPIYEKSIAQLKEIDQFFQKFQSALPLCTSAVKEDSDKGYSIIKELFK